MSTHNRRPLQPMPGLSARAQRLLRPVPNQIVIPKGGSPIPQALRTEKTK